MKFYVASRREFEEWDVHAVLDTRHPEGANNVLLTTVSRVLKVAGEETSLMFSMRMARPKHSLIFVIFVVLPKRIVRRV